MHVTLRFYGDLADLVDEVEQAVPIGRRRSVKDVVESVGVPHPEVGVLVVDGQSVGFDHLVAGGERVAVYPPFQSLAPPGEELAPPPPQPARFVLDVHLGTLTRRLRALGFDCWYRNDADDVLLAQVATDEDRILLTRDRGLLMRGSVVHGYLPRSHDPEVQLLEVTRRYALADQLAPRTRCIRCNGPLEAVDKAEVVDELPPRTRVEHDRFTRCRDCGRIYWPGSHLRAIDAVADRVRAAGGRA